MTASVCFAHANGFPSASYRKLLEVLGEDYRIFAPEKVGHDPRFPVDANWGSLSQELIHFIETRIGEPVLGVGHSLGGMLTFLAALQRPDLFRAFVMLDPPAYLGLEAWTMQLAKRRGFIDRITPAGKTRGRRTRWPSHEAAYESLRTKGLFQVFDPDCLWDYIKHGTEQTEEGVRLIYDPMVEVEVFRNIPHDLAKYPPVQVPGAIICGDVTDVSRPAHMRRLARRHRLELSSMPGGHMFPFEHPIETGQALRELLPRLREKASAPL